MTRHAVLRIEGVEKSFESAGVEFSVLSGVTFDVYTDEIVGIVGPSGVGKTTLLNIVAGELEPDAGVVRWGRMEQGSGARAAAATMIFQEDTVFPWMRVIANVGFSALVQTKGVRRRTIQDARTFLKELGLGDFERSWPRELSGGMRKRVELARAMFAEPKLLLLDEAFGSLDAVTKVQTHTWFMEKLNSLELSAILVTHDLREVAKLCDRILVLKGTPAKIGSEMPGLRRESADPIKIAALEAKLMAAIE